ncbi:MAG: hypothetical protein K8I60_04785 [Anaerolineae bacterium]|nr:hypothetical protein [Anaerolineae bacterium]
MKAEPDTPSQPQSGINKEALCRSLLEIVAYLDETQYTDGSPFIDRRAEVVQHSDPADPASAEDTPQG